MTKEDQKRVAFITLIAVIALGILASSLYFVVEDKQKEMAVLSQGPIEAVFTDRAGKEHKLSEFRGKPILLNLWATWCGHCVNEMEDLNKLAAHMKEQGAVLLAISADEHAGKVVAFNHREKIDNLPIFMDSEGEVAQTIRSRGLPTTVFINPEGKIVERVEGEFAWLGDQAKALLKEKLNVSIP